MLKTVFVIKILSGYSDNDVVVVKSHEFPFIPMKDMEIVIENVTLTIEKIVWYETDKSFLCYCKNDESIFEQEVQVEEVIKEYLLRGWIEVDSKTSDQYFK